MKDFDYQHWLAFATRVSRRRDEAPDLLHDALLEAIRAERADFSRATNRSWFAGILRNRAAMDARSAIRRKRREVVVARHASDSHPPARPDDCTHHVFLASLPPSARAVATLILAGMNKTEIVAALDLTDASFRQRLTSIRKRWQPTALANDAPVPRSNTRDDVGLIRQALLSHLKWKRGHALGTHDPDGHLIVLESSPKIRSQIARARQRKSG